MEKTDLDLVVAGEFAWGNVRHIYPVGPYAIVEYVDREGKVCFHPYVRGEDTCWSLETFDTALIAAVAFANGQPGTMAQAACRVLCLDPQRV